MTTRRPPHRPPPSPWRRRRPRREVGGERLDHTGLGLRPGGRHVDGVRVLLPPLNRQPNILQPLLSWILTLSLALQTFASFPAHAHDAKAIRLRHRRSAQSHEPSSRAKRPRDAAFDLEFDLGCSGCSATILPELEQTWVAALELTKGKLLSARISDNDKAAYFSMWIERLRLNAFSQGSAVDPDSRYYTSHSFSDMRNCRPKCPHVQNEEEILEDIAAGKAISELPPVSRVPSATSIGRN